MYSDSVLYILVTFQVKSTNQAEYIKFSCSTIIQCLETFFVNFCCTAFCGHSMFITLLYSNCIIQGFVYGCVFRCSCGDCVPLENVSMCQCCHETDLIDEKRREKNLRCITKHPGFEGNCLNEDVVDDFLANYGHIGDDEPVHEEVWYLLYTTKHFHFHIYNI